MLTHSEVYLGLGKIMALDGLTIDACSETLHAYYVDKVKWTGYSFSVHLMAGIHGSHAIFGTFSEAGKAAFITFDPLIMFSAGAFHVLINGEGEVSFMYIHRIAEYPNVHYEASFIRGSRRSDSVREVEKAFFKEILRIAPRDRSAQSGVLEEYTRMLERATAKC